MAPSPLLPLARKTQKTAPSCILLHLLLTGHHLLLEVVLQVEGMWSWGALLLQGWQHLDTCERRGGGVGRGWGGGGITELRACNSVFYYV